MTKAQGTHEQQKSQWFNKSSNLIDEISFGKSLKDVINRNVAERIPKFKNPISEKGSSNFVGHQLR